MQPKVSITVAFVAGAALTLVACSNSDSGGHSNQAAANVVKRPAIKTQPIVAPCEWLPQQAVEAVLGKYAAMPLLGRNAESPRPDEDGAACVYSIASPKGAPIQVAVEVDAVASNAFESAMGMLGGHLSQVMAGGRPEAADAPAPSKARDGWDYVGGLPTMTVYRVGHVGVSIGGDLFHVPSEVVDRLAAQFRERIADIPFASPGDDPNVAGPQPDPCSLLTQAEAEAVLGKLQVAPFRSNESTPLANGAGPSCTFYTPGHHAFVMTPTLTGGEQQFRLASGVGGLVRSTVGGADKGDVLDGPWDQSTSGSTGSLYFLKGDKLLELTYTTSSTDLSGATRLAQAAVGRL